MAHSLSAKKRIRQNLKRRSHNRARKEVIKATGLIQQQIFVKALGGQWPCVINSASLSATSAGERKNE